MTQDQINRLRAKVARIANLAEFIRRSDGLLSRSTLERFRDGRGDPIPATVGTIAAQVAAQRPKLKPMEIKQ